MIQFADKAYRPQIRSMWKTCFEDTEEYMELYFSRVYQDENTLFCTSDKLAVASLQMLPYSISFYGQNIPFAYIAGACTLPEHRKKGYMEKLLIKSFRVMEQRNIPLTILIPGEEWLYGFYEKYGYTQCFRGDDTIIPLKEIFAKNECDIDKSYIDFQKLFATKNLCVQKSRDDFETIVLEGKLDNCPEKTNLSAMARVIDPFYMLTLFAEGNTTKDFSIEVNDDLLESRSTFVVKQGTCKKENTTPDLKVDINLLTRLLFGFETSKLDSSYSSLFEEHQPIINLMLE